MTNTHLKFLTYPYLSSANEIFSFTQYFVIFPSSTTELWSLTQTELTPLTDLHTSETPLCAAAPPDSVDSDITSITFIVVMINSTPILHSISGAL